MKNTIRWGVAGPGNIANKFARAVKNVQGAELVAVASRSAERGRAFAEKYDIPNVFESYEEMAASDVDAVYVATPHPFHKPCAEIFINAGKHVLCEKPVCVNAEEAKKLKALAEKNSVFLMEAMWTRFLPAIVEAKKIAESGEIGEIRGVRADFCGACTINEDSKLFRNDMAGGSLLDIGIYSITFASVMLGDKPKTVSTVANVKNGIDLSTSIVLQYENGEIAELSSAIDTDKPADGFVFGTKGYMRIPQFYGGNEIFVSARSGDRHVSKPSIGDGFEEEIIEACSCIRQGKQQSDVMPMSKSIEILELIDLIRKQIGLRYPMDEK